MQEFITADINLIKIEEINKCSNALIAFINDQYKKKKFLSLRTRIDSGDFKEYLEIFGAKYHFFLLNIDEVIQCALGVLYENFEISYEGDWFGFAKKQVLF